MNTLHIDITEFEQELLPTSYGFREGRNAHPEPGTGELRIKVSACGVCHTELDEIEGRTAPPRLPVVPGHEVVGRVDYPLEEPHRALMGLKRNPVRGSKVLLID